jgi:glycosyltransferase involved in cell wall biosynthesis
LTHFRDQVRIADRVHFLGPRTDVDRLLAEADCLWCPSEREDIPQALLEAQLRFLPVVASQIPPHRRFVEDGQNGLLFRVGDRAGLARATMTLLDDASLGARLAANARQRLPSADSAFFEVPVGRNLPTHSYRHVYEALTDGSTL